MRTTISKKALAELSSDNPRVKYRRAKSLVAIAKQDPRLLYPHLPFFAKLLRSENNIMTWTAIDILGYLTALARANRATRLLNLLSGFLRSGKLITANHSISALSHIAAAVPAHRQRAIQELLKVERYGYETDECHNIALGKVVQAFSSLEDSNRDAQILEFVRHQTRNSRPATRKRAEEFLKRTEARRSYDG